MRKFEFRLDSVLKIQQRKKRLAELRRQQTLHILTKAEQEVGRVQQELGRMAEGLRQTLSRGGSPAAWQAFAARSRWLGNELTAAEHRMQKAKLDFVEANEQYRQMAIAVEVLLTLRQRRWQEYKDEVAAQEQQRVEEYVLRRWTQDLADEKTDASGGKIA